MFRGLFPIVTDLKNKINAAKIVHFSQNSKFFLKYLSMTVDISNIYCTFALGSEEKYRTCKEAFAIISR